MKEKVKLEWVLRKTPQLMWQGKFFLKNVWIKRLSWWFMDVSCFAGRILFVPRYHYYTFCCSMWFIAMETCETEKSTKFFLLRKGKAPWNHIWKLWEYSLFSFIIKLQSWIGLEHSSSIADAMAWLKRENFIKFIFILCMAIRAVQKMLLM